MGDAIRGEGGLKAGVSGSFRQSQALSGTAAVGTCNTIDPPVFAADGRSEGARSYQVSKGTGFGRMMALVGGDAALVAA
jgi:hypothetical protein